MFTRTYLDKCATIIKNSAINTGLNPVSDLVWGTSNSRMLIHFDESLLKSKVEDKTYADISKLHHKLHITNAGSFDDYELHSTYSSQITGGEKKRTSSFDLIFFKIPMLWDRGKGFNYTTDLLDSKFYDTHSPQYDKYYSTNGVNWFQPRTGYSWGNPIKTETTKNDYFEFNVISDKIEIPYDGSEVEFTYNCLLDGVPIANAYVRFEQYIELMPNDINDDTFNVLGNPTPEVYNPIYIDKDGHICTSRNDIKDKAVNMKRIVKIGKNKFDKYAKYYFRVKYIYIQDDIEKTYYSNPYCIIQMPNGQKLSTSPEDGIYSTQTLSIEYDKFSSDKGSNIIVARQHFDIGNEDIDIDITDYVNDILLGKAENNGLGIAYSPILENGTSIFENYTGFLTDKTNTFFEPYVYTTYDEVIDDNRSNFILGKDNRLYLYSNIGGELTNLDQLPICKIDDEFSDVYQASKGVYYTNVNIPSSASTAPTIHFDTWYRLIYQDTALEPVELNFTTRNKFNHFAIGSALPPQGSFKPSIYGIKDNERVFRGDVRKLCVLIKEKYTTNIGTDIKGIEVRLYIKDGTRECDVMPYTKIHHSFLEYYMMLDTSMLIPETYYIDVRIKYGMEDIANRDLLHFTVVENLDNKFM